MKKITAYLIAYNEEAKIRDAVSSVLWADEVIVAEMIPIASGGQALAIIAGSSNWNVDDNARYSFTNVGEGLFVSAFDRLFDMYRRGLSLPQNYSSAETILDSLTT